MTLRISIAPDHTTFVTEAGTFLAPIGDATLAETIESDPPRPEELTNAIGMVIDHLDDLLREQPAVVGLPAELSGEAAGEIAAVEVGATPALPMTLSRDAAEDVFRTVATERRADRARNPGLSARMVDTIVGACCIVVAIMRRLQLDEVTVVESSGARP